MADEAKTSKELQAELAAAFAALLPQAVAIAQVRREGVAVEAAHLSPRLQIVASCALPPLP